jgi:hypothetical protein
MKWIVIVAAATVVTAACSSSEPGASGSTVTAEAAPDTAPVHGDHTPKYGGVVLMNGDLHFEVVLEPSGDYRVYFSDAARKELPAAIASDVTITVTQKGSPSELVRLEIDEAGESWMGKGREGVNQTEAVARVGYAFQGEPYWIDLPFKLPESGVPDPHKKPASSFQEKTPGVFLQFS